MVTSIGLRLESSKDNDEDSEKEGTDWGLVFMLLKNRGFSHEEILNLSYPQFNAYMKKINNPLTYSVTIPYMGGGDKEEETAVGSKEELLSIVADMNKDFI